MSSMLISCEVKYGDCHYYFLLVKEGVEESIHKK